MQNLTKRAFTFSYYPCQVVCKWRKKKNIPCFFLLPIIQAWLFPARKFLGRIAPTIHRLDKPIRGIVGAILAVALAPCGHPLRLHNAQSRITYSALLLLHFSVS